MGLIYKLVSSHEQLVYVGKTEQTFKDRFSRHKSHYKSWLNGKQCYKSSYELIKHNDCIMIVLEIDVPKNMLASREGYYHSQLDCVNIQTPNRTNKEWREDNREKIANHKSEKVTCKCGCIVSRVHMARHRKSTKHKICIASVLT